MDYGKYLLPAYAALMIVEIIAGRHKNIYSRDDWYINLIGFVAGFIIRPAAAILIGYTTAFLIPVGRGTLSHMNFALGAVLVWVACEFCFYWVHRWAHDAQQWRHSFLWTLHRTHHSGKYLNVSVIFRIHPLWWFVLPDTWVLGIAAYLGLEKQAALAAFITGVWNVVTHSNFRWDDAIRRRPVIGRLFWALEHVIVSPGIHHTHHGFGKDGANYRNYAVMLSFWDWIFGTLHLPTGRPARYGLPGAQAVWTEQLFSPFTRLSRAKRQPTEP